MRYNQNTDNLLKLFGGRFVREILNSGVNKARSGKVINIMSLETI